MIATGPAMTLQVRDRDKVMEPHAPAAPAERDEGHDDNGHPASHSRGGMDAWIRELAQAAPPLTPAQRHALALLLSNPRPAHARPAGAAVPGQRT